MVDDNKGQRWDILLDVGITVVMLLVLIVRHNDVFFVTGAFAGFVILIVITKWDNGQSKISKKIMRDRRYKSEIALTMLLLLIGLYYPYYTTSPLPLYVCHTNSSDGTHLNVFVQSKDWGGRKPNIINLYALDENPHIPINQFSGTKLSIRDEWAFIGQIPIKSLPVRYKVTCDSCQADGIIRSSPNFPGVSGTDGNGECTQELWG